MQIIMNQITHFQLIKAIEGHTGTFWAEPMFSVQVGFSIQVLSKRKRGTTEMEPLRAFINATTNGILGVVHRFCTFTTGIFGAKQANKFSFLSHIFRFLQLKTRTFKVYPSITLVTLDTILSIQT